MFTKTKISLVLMASLSIGLTACTVPTIPQAVLASTPPKSGDQITNNTYNVNTQIDIHAQGTVQSPVAVPSAVPVYAVATPKPTPEPIPVITPEPVATMSPTPVPESYTVVNTEPTPEPVVTPTPDPRIGIERQDLFVAPLQSDGIWSSCLSGADYQAYFEAQKQQGLFPANLRARVLDGKVCYQSIMQPMPGNVTQGEFRYGWDANNFEKEKQILLSQGYQQMLQQVVTATDLQDLYQSIWYKWATPEPKAAPVSVWPKWNLRITQVDDKILGFVNKTQVIEAKWGYQGINAQAQPIGHVPGDSLPVELNTYLQPGQDNYIRLDLENSAVCCSTSASVELYKDDVFVSSEPFFRDDSTAGIKMHWLIKIDSNGNLSQFQSFNGDVLPPEF